MTIDSAVTNSTARVAPNNPQPLIVTPGRSMLAVHRIERLNRKEPIANEMKRKRLVTRSKTGQSKNISTVIRNVNNTAVNKLSM
jgi:hypothetical protein